VNYQSSPFPTINHETTEFTGIGHTDGVISMARGGLSHIRVLFVSVISLGLILANSATKICGGLLRLAML